MKNMSKSPAWRIVILLSVSSGLLWGTYGDSHWLVHTSWPVSLWSTVFLPCSVVSPCMAQMTTWLNTVPAASTRSLQVCPIKWAEYLLYHSEKLTYNFRHFCINLSRFYRLEMPPRKKTFSNKERSGAFSIINKNVKEWKDTTNT